ncbi:MAG: hypothetical protein Q3X10_03805 [Collinsella sp.]|nr:hypothetical protein [Collinsella sp.]
MVRIQHGAPFQFCSNPLDVQSGGFALFVVVQRDQYLVLRDDRLPHERLQQRRVVERRPALQEVGEALRVYPLVRDGLEVVPRSRLLLLELGYALVHARRYHALLDGVEDVPQAPLRGPERVLGLPAASPHLGRVRALRYHVGYLQRLAAVAEQPAQRRGYGALELLAPDVADARPRAAVVLVLDVVPAPAAHALQVPATFRAQRRSREGEVAPVLARALLAALDSLDLHERHLVHYRRHPALADDASPLVPSRVPAVAQHLLHHRLAARVALARPEAATRELARYRVHGHALKPQREGLAHPRRLRLVDLVLVVPVPAVPEDAHAVGLALEGVALHSALGPDGGLPRLAGGEPLEQLLVDDALRAVGYLLEGRDQLDAAHGELTLVYRRVVLAAAEAVHHVDEDDLARAGVGYHPLELGAVVGAPRHGAVAVLRRDLVALARAPLAADAQLVLD